jgi:capsular exopolysaccharide synthesis family protein
MTKRRHDYDLESDSDGGMSVVPLRTTLPARQVDLQPGYAPERDQPGGVELMAMIEKLLRRRWLILTCLMFGVMVAVAASLLTTPMYRAKAVIEVQRQEARIMEGSDIEPQTIADAEYMATQNALLKSRSLAERTVERLHLADNPRYAGKNKDAPRPIRTAQAIDSLLERLEINPVARSRVISIGYVSSDPTEAAAVLNELTEGFIQVNLERKYNTTKYARTFLEERIASTKTALEESERRIAGYARDNGILELGESGASLNNSLDATSLQALNQALAEAERKRIEAEQKFQEATQSGSVEELVKSDLLRELGVRRADLAAQKQELLRTFKPDYPDVQAIQSKLDTIDGEITTARKSILISLQSAYNAALASEQQLRTRVGELTQDVQELRNRSIDYTILQREVDTNRSQYEALLQRYKEIAIAGGVGSSQVAIVDRADTPREPFSPSHLRNLALALVLSMAVAIGLALLLDFLDDTLKSPEDVRRKLGEAVIGVAPKMKVRGGIERELSDPRSIISEAFQSIRASLAFSTAHGTPKSILVCSCKPSEGKTSSVTALANAIARTGKRVLIIDADMRKPSFAVQRGASIGLSGLLSSQASLESAVVDGRIPNVSLLPSGTTPPNPAELLANDRLNEIIREAEDQYDVVVVDSPPVLGFADGPLLGAACKPLRAPMPAKTNAFSMCSTSISHCQEPEACCAQ